jgi:hypothetical protein
MKQNFDYLLQPDLTPRPRTRGRFSIPDLWEKAKAMFARMIEVAGGEDRVRGQRRLTRKQRYEILGWLEPVEKLARAVLLVRALTHLLMTPEGRRLMKETPKQAPWKEEAPQPPPGSVRSTRIPHPGWHTIWQKPCLAPPPPPPPPRPASRGCAFRILRVTPPEPLSPISPSRRPMITDLWAKTQPSVLRPPARVSRQDPVEAKARPSRLARRIDALSRALANPEPIIRRLARFIASLPQGLLQPTTGHASAGGLWRHGQPEFVDVCFHLSHAIGAHQRIEPG